MTQALSAAERRDLLVSVGTHRGARRLSPLQVATLFERARGAGATLAECGKLAGFSGSAMVTRFLRLLDLPDAVRELVAWGRSETTLAFTAASEIARLPAELREPVARAVVEAQLGTGEVTQVVQRLMRSAVSPEGAVEDILRLRPQVERRHVFIGRFADERLVERLATTGTEERSVLMRRALRAVADAVSGEARLSPSGFVVVTDDAGAAVIHGVDDMESALGAALANALEPR